MVQSRQQTESDAYKPTMQIAQVGSKRSREHREMKREQEKREKGARGKKLKGARSKGGN